MYTHSLVALSLFILSFVDTFDHLLACPLIFPLTYHSHTLSHLLAPPRKPSFSISCNESSLLHSTHSPALSLCLSLVASPCAFSFPAAHFASRCIPTHPRTRIFPLLLASPPLSISRNGSSLFHTPLSFHLRFSLPGHFPLRFPPSGRTFSLPLCHLHKMIITNTPRCYE